MAATGTTSRNDSSSSSGASPQEQEQEQRSLRPTRVPKRWHALDNSAVRSHIVSKLSKLFPALERARLSAAAPSPTTATVVQRLEWMLYHAAHSRREYANECSLERRVQALVTQQLTTAAPTRSPSASPDERKPSQHAVAGPCPRPSCAKRPRRASLSALSIDDLSPHRASYKRRRRESFHTTARSLDLLAVAAAPRAAVRHLHVSFARHASSSSSTLFLNNDVALVAQVFQFLDGHEVVRARAVNQFLAAHALRMVHALTLDVRALRHVAPGAVTVLLQRCPHVRALTVTNTLKPSPSDLPRGYSAPLGREPRQFGADVVAQATAAFARGACPLLETLALCAPFEFATESDAIVACLDALAQRHLDRCEPHQRAPTAPLKRLVLDATFLGDARVEALAQRITRAPQYFQSLETLVLRRNFVGEAGASALFHALRSCPQLAALDVSSNILTDTDAMALADAIARTARRRRCLDGEADDASVSAPFQALTRVGLHENFIGLDGFAALASALSARKRLVHVAHAHNCAPLAHAARLFEA